MKLILQTTEHFHETAIETMVHGEPITTFRPDAPASRAIVEIWRSL
jgi:hypothetical protein